MQVHSLHVHPVKSTAIRTVTTAPLLRSGLRDDRRWMVVDDTGGLVSARTDPALFRITARTRALDGIDAELRLTADGMADLDVAAPPGEPEPYRIHSGTGFGVRAGAAADRWIGAVLGRDDVHLLWCPDLTRRELDPQYAEPGDSTGFADAYPVLLTTRASLDRLNEWIADAARLHGEDPVRLPMARFRPSVVVSGSEPFAEDGWARVRIGRAVLRVAKPSARCVMTTVDPVTLDRGREPLRTLAHRRRADGKLLFGMLLIPETTAELSVGDPVVPQ